MKTSLPLKSKSKVLTMRNVYGSVFSALAGVLLVGMFLFGTTQEAKAQCAVEFINCPNDTIVYPPFPPEICDALIQVNTPSAVLVGGGCVGQPITITQLTGPTSGTYPVGVYTVIFVATAPGADPDTCSYTITIADTVAPSITNCPGDIVIYNDPDTCGAVATWVAPTASDACGIASFISNFNSGTFFPTGTTVVSYVATDNNGNTSECSFEVTVLDTVVPVITFCPADTVYTLSPLDACPFFLQLPEVVIDDDCADNALITATGATTFAFIGTDPSETYNVGVTTVTIFVDDGSGNTTSCSFTVEIVDNITPLINCTAVDITVNNDAGLCEANVAVPTVSATDNCSYTITNDYNAQSSVNANLNVVDVFPVGTTTVTFTVTDEGGNTATCSIDVIVNDTEVPVIDCSAAGSPILVSTDPGVCYATISFDVTATDNCGYTISNDYNAQTSTNATLSFTDQIPPGVYTITFTATDTSGNTAICTVDITVEDTEAPVINCVGFDLPTEPGVCETDSVWSYPSFTDNCDPNPTINHISGPIPGDVLTPGGYLIEFEAVDASGNSAFCAFFIVVVDEEAPVLTCDPAAPASIALDANCQGVVPDVVTGSSATDNCPGPITITQSPLAGTVITGHQTVTIIVTAQDVSGNTSTCSIDIDFNDITPPTATCQADPLLTTSSNGVGDCTGGGMFNAIEIQDNCQFRITTYVVNESGDTIASLLEQGPFSAPVPTMFLFTYGNYPLGVNVNHYTVIDSGGNTVTCNQTVTVTDDEDPTISCPGPIVQATDPDTCGATLLFTVTAADNCAYTISNDFNAQTSNNGALLFNDFVPQSVTSILFTVTDTAGNTATCSVDITIVDTQAPYLTCPPDIFTNTLNSFVCYDIVTWNPPIADDNCAGIVINQQTTTWPNPGLYAANDWKDPYVVVYYAEDASGNTATCSFTIVVYDTVRPQFSGCPVDVTIPYDATDCVTEYNWTPPTGSDNCSGLIVTSTHAPGFNFQIGTTTVTYTARDSSGNTAVCSFDVTVEDTVPPTIICHNDTTLFNDLDECGALYSWMEPEVMDDCDTVTTLLRSVVVPYNFTTGGSADTTVLNIYMIPGTFTNDDVTLTIYHRGDIDAPSERFNVHGEDFSLLGATNNGGQCDPVYTQTAINLTATQFNAWAADGQVTIILAPQTSSINDFCAPNQDAYASVTLDEINITRTQVAGLANGSMFPVGTDTIVYEVTDAFGNVTTCSWVVTVVDTQRPAILCPADVMAFNDPGMCSANLTIPLPSTSDNCAVAFFFHDSPYGVSAENASGVYPVGSYTVTYIIQDVNGNTNSCSFTIEVEDNEPPVAICQNQTVFLDASGNASVTVAQINNGSSDNCGIDNITLSQSNFTCADVGVNVVVMTVTDIHGNTATCSATVTVVDNMPPMALCQNINLPLDSNGMASITVGDIDNGSWDNCGIDTMWLSQYDFDCTDLGNNSVTLFVRDVNGNLSFCTANVNVIDNQPPVALCQDITVYLNSAGTVSITANDVDGGSYDNCTIVNRSIDISSFTCNDVGPNTVTLTVTDQSGNTSTCTSIVTVVDSTRPFLVCPSSLTANNAFGMCGNSIQGLNLGFLSDNCGIDTFWNDWTGTQSANAFYPVGVTTVTYYAIDVNNNTGTCSFTVTIIDFEKPTLTCPGNITVSNDPGQCDAIVNYTVTVFDNCLGDSLYLTSGLPSGSAFPIGVTTVSYLAIDASGNTSTCSFNVTVNDTAAPTVTNCSANITVPNGVGDCGAVVFYPTPVFTDNCSGSIDTVTIPCDYTISVSGTNWGDATTWTFTDASNTVVASGGPYFTFPGFSQTVTVSSGNPPLVFSITTALGDNSASFSVESNNILLLNGFVGGNSNFTSGPIDGNCTTISSGWPVVTFNGIGSGGFFPVGVSTETYIATDSAGNSTTCEFTVTVEDQEPPVIVCPSNITVNTDPGVCQAFVAIAVPFTDDNCGVATVVNSHTGTNNASGVYQEGTTTVVYTVTDIHGNVTTCSFTVTVNDNEAPVITCPPSVTIPNNPGVCYAVYTFAPATATDNCGIANISQTGGLVSGSQFPVGINTVTYAAIDIHGNVTQCSFTVTVEDVEIPVIACPPSITVNNDSAMCGANVAILSPTIIENCLFTLTNSYNGTTDASDFYPVGTTTVVFTITDQGLNTATCSFDVTVVDVELPILTCPADITVPNLQGFCGASVAFNSPTAFDNCPGVTVVQTAGLPSQSLFPVGSTTNEFLATDQNGNTATCSFVVTVVDTQAPEIVFCPSNILVQNDQGVCGAIVTWPLPIAFDNCNDFSWSNNFNSGDFFPVGTTVIIYIATDSAGNSAQCSFDVTVEDTEAPVFTSCPFNISTCDPVVNWVQPNVSDNCGVASITSTHSSGSTFPVGTTTVVYNATDSSGNTATCSFTVTIHPLPVADAGSDVAVCSGIGAVIGGMPTASGGTSPYTYSWAPTTGLSSATVANPTATPTATTTYTVTVTDDNGCQATDEVTVTVRPLPTVSAGSNVAICIGQSTTIGGNPSASGTVGPYLFSWEPATGLSSSNAANPVATPTVTTIYTLTVTDAFGCQNSATITVTVHPLPNATITPAGPFCLNDPAVTLTAATAGGTWSGNGITNPATGAFSPAAAGVGIHLITYSVTDVNGCFNSATTTITVHAMPNSRILPAGPFCTSDAPVFLAGIPNLNPHTWSGPGVNPSTGQFNPTVAGAGSHTITYTVTNANGCTDMASIVITVNAAPVVTINPAGPYCETEPVQVLTANLSGGIWSGPGIIQSQLGQFLPVAASAGVHHIVYTFTQSATGCTARDTTQITVFEVPAISSSVTNASCPDASNGAVDITVTGGTQPYSYQWSNGANTQDLSGIAAGTYRVTVTDANNCTQTAAVTVGISTNPVSVTAIITPAWTPSSSNGAINVTVTGGVPPYTFLWSNGATTEDVDGLMPGTYQLVVVDAAGCSYLFFYNVPSGGVNVDLVDIERNIILYPNPTSDVVNIDIEVGGNVVDLSMTVFDVLGRTMYVTHHNFSGKLTETISTSAWASGHYMVRFNVDGQQFTKKFVVTK